VDARNYLELRLDEVLERLATSGQAPGGGSAAALTVAFAAGLVAMVARDTEGWEDAEGISAQALAVRDRAAALADNDAEAWEDALAALRRAGSDTSPGGDRGSFELEQKLDLAAAIPLEIAELGAAAAELAALAAERGSPAYRADAAAAAALAAGGARAAAHLVEVNLVVREGEDRLLRARASEQEAADAAERVLALGR
jgi:formiminotetrahydrofolate cyclodeaminase